MSVKSISNLALQDKDVTIQIQVHRKWEYRGISDDGPILHVSMILTDSMGNVIYAEIPTALVADKNPLFEVDKVYNIRRFRVAKAKSSYRSVDGPFMIYITPYTMVDICCDPPPTFPRYVYRLSCYNEIDPYGSRSKDFYDVIGMITDISEINQVYSNITQSPSMKRDVFIKDLSDNIIKVTLWGKRALEFSYDSIYNHEEQNIVVVLFVGCLAKGFKGTASLSGSAACHWYFNPDIEEAEPYYKRILSEEIKLKLPPCSSQQPASCEPIKREHKELKDLLEFNPFDFPLEGYECTVTITRIPENSEWWYISCKRCSKKMAIQGTTYQCLKCRSTDYHFRYKLTFMASDGTTEAKMFCFDNIAKAIIGKPCTSLVASVGNTSRIPPEIASIVSLRFTFVVTFTEKSFEVLDKVFLIKSIVQAYGRDRLLPQIQQNVNLLSPSTPIKPNTSPNVNRMLLYSPTQNISPTNTGPSEEASSQVNQMLIYSPIENIKPTNTGPSGEALPQYVEKSKETTIPSFLESPPKRAKQEHQKLNKDKDTSSSGTKN